MGINMTVSKLIFLFAFLSISAMVKSDSTNTTTSSSITTAASIDPTTDSTNTTTTSSLTTTATIDHTTKGFLLLGGYNDSTFLDNVEAYGSDLSLPSLPSLPLPLRGHIAEMTESGAVYVAGGVNGDSAMIDKTLMLSSLSTPKWEEVEARMPRPVYYAGSVVVGEIILVLGGWWSAGGSDGINGFGASIDTIQMLDTSKSLPQWEQLWLSKLPEPLHYHSSAVFESQVIIVTRSGVTYTTSVSSIISDTELDWVKGKLPGVGGVVNGPSVEVVEDKLVAVHKNKVFTKNTMDSQWVQLEPLPQVKRFYPSIGSVQGNIVIGGGYDGHTHREVSATVFMWVEASREWDEVTSLKIPRWGHATIQLPKDL